MEVDCALSGLGDVRPALGGFGVSAVCSGELFKKQRLWGGLGQRAEQHWERMNVETTALLGTCRSICNAVARSFVCVGRHGPAVAGRNGLSGCRVAGS